MRTVLERDLTATEASHVAQRLYTAWRTKRAMQGKLLPIWTAATDGDRAAWIRIAHEARSVIQAVDIEAVEPKPERNSK